MQAPLPRLLLLVAVVLLAIAGLGEHPAVLEDIELVPAGLAFGFGALLADR
jgi:hypothetical protein